MSASLFAKSSSQRVDPQAQCDPTVPIPLSAREKSPPCSDVQLAEQLPASFNSLPQVDHMICVLCVEVFVHVCEPDRLKSQLYNNSVGFP